MKTKSELYLLNNIDLDSNYNYTIDFDNITMQSNYFDNHIDNTFLHTEDYSFIRENIIRIDGNIEDFNNINYLYYINDKKRYYAFIIDKKYINSEVTELELKIDILQTYMFDYQLNEVFVEREHQDRFYKLKLSSGEVLHPKFNIEPENLNIGEDMTELSEEVVSDNIDDLENEIVFMEVVSTEPLADYNKGGYNSNDPTTYKNLTTKLIQHGLDLGIYTYLTPISFKHRNKKFYTYDGTGQIKRISNVSIFNNSNAILSIRLLKYCPIKFNVSNYNDDFLITFYDGYTDNANDNKNIEPASMRVISPNNSNFGGIDTTLYKSSTFLSIASIYEDNENSKMSTKIEQKLFNVSEININEPKSKSHETKLLTNPYYYHQLCDYQSTPLKIKNENIILNSNIFYKQSLGIQAKSKIYVNSYLGDENGKEHNSINSTMCELPILNDAYISYMSQNKASATSGQALNVGVGLASLGLGLATGGIGFAIAGSQALGIGSQIAREMIKRQDMKDSPDSIRQMGNNAEFDIADKNFKYILKTFRINNKFSDKIFNYFYHYGYKCNDFKKPNIKSRYYFNYIKTIGCTIKGNFNNDIKNEICDIYNNGITFWHYRNGQTFKGINNYDYENAEIRLMEGINE